MNRFNIPEHRREQLRAVEAELLRTSSPIPDDPVQEFPPGWHRAATAGSLRANRRPAPIAIPDNEQREQRRAGGGGVNAVAVVDREENQPNEQNNNDQDEGRRPLSPTEIPGVRAIPKDFNRYFRGLLQPGEYFAKSITRYLGPFDQMPTAENVPAGDNYIILQRMGRLPDSGKSIFRQVGNLLT